MKKTSFLLAAIVVAGEAAFGASQLKINADRIAADSRSEALVASGRVVAVAHPYRLHADFVERNAEGLCHFADPTLVTTCTNELCELHWGMRGELDYQDEEFIRLKNVKLYAWDIPIFWLPYYYYALNTDTGFRWMPGYTSRWGAYLLTKYLYHLAGDRSYAEGSYYLHGNTRFDLRSERGIAFGEGLDWQLGDFGRGAVNFYYAYDLDGDDHYRYNPYGLRGRTGDFEGSRYGITLRHRWEATERDTVRIGGEYYSDPRFRDDFYRRSFFGHRNQWIGYEGSEFAWEHRENPLAVGIAVSGSLNDFVASTMRLPELYFDVNPLPVWSLPVNYETQNRIGFLKRRSAEYDVGEDYRLYRHSPGVWADYDTFRFDTYHRFTAPFKAGEVLSVVPRVGYHGTYWQNSGYISVDPAANLGDSGDALMRSILEGGITFSARGVAQLNNGWRHLVEPYLDVLAQKAWYSGNGRASRQYFFDSIDASLDWADQFAGRSRNLPYSYFGVTPGVRNVLMKTDDKGSTRTVADVDLYVAWQGNDSDTVYDNGVYRVAELGDPNFDRTWVPGARVRWFVDKDTMLSARVEYDTEENRLAMCNLNWSQRLDKDFSYYLSFSQRRHRYWDFGESPYNKAVSGMDEDMNGVHFSLVSIGFEHELCDAIAWSPFIRWDCRYSDLDSVGAWIDYRTDCLGFRFQLEYENSYRRCDGYEYDEDWNFGFFVYLRAFGPEASDLFQQ